VSAQEGLFSPFHRPESPDAIASLTYPASFMLAAAMNPCPFNLVQKPPNGPNSF